jgi:hypothetical protein
MCALVEPDGNVVSRSVLQDSVQTHQHAGSSVGFDGTIFLVAWIGWPYGGRLTAYFVRVSPQGGVLDSSPRLVVPDVSYEQYAVAVAFHSGRYLVLWYSYEGDLRGSFILRDGSVPDSSGFRIRAANGITYPALTHDGHHFVACWSERPSLIKVARITDDGEVLDTSGICIDSFSYWETDVFSQGETTMAALPSGRPWGNESTAVMVVRLDTALNRLDSAPLVLGRRENGNTHLYGPGQPSVGMCGGDYIVVWCQPYHMDSAYGSSNAVFRRVTPQGQPVESAPVIASYGVNRHACPDLATDGSNYFAVWEDYRRTQAADSQSVRGVRFSPDGTILDPVPINLGGTNPLRPALAYGGGRYLVAWYDWGNIYAVRVTPGGQLLDSAAVQLNGTEYLPSLYLDVAYGDSEFLVAWQTMGGASPNQVHGVRVTPAGNILDPVPVLLQATVVDDCGYPQAGFDGTNFFVTCTDSESWPLVHLGARINSAGHVLDSEAIVIGRASPNSAVAELAYGGGCYLATDSRTGASWRISPEGVVLESVPLGYADDAHVVFDGTDFMLLCERDNSSELGAMRVAPDGRVLDSVPFLLVSTDSIAVSVPEAAMAANNTGHVGLVFRSSEPLPFGAGRIRAAAFRAVGGGIHEDLSNSAVRWRVWPSITCRVLNISPAIAGNGLTRIGMFDAAGRRALDLRPGPNDVRSLAPGVYFVRAVSREPLAVSCRKVVIQR